MENKKVIGATATTYDGISFKSLAEKRAYQLFKEANLNPVYEVSKILIMQGFKPNTPFYTHKKGKGFVLNTDKLRDMTYTPDFIIQGKFTYYVEIKGFRTDSYNVKVKLFRKWLESQQNCMFFELHTIGDMKKAIEIIKNNEKSI